jgi:hypothetical protein
VTCPIPSNDLYTTINADLNVGQSATFTCTTYPNGGSTGKVTSP